MEGFKREEKRVGAELGHMSLYSNTQRLLNREMLSLSQVVAGPCGASPDCVPSHCFSRAGVTNIAYVGLRRCLKSLVQ
jgi:hypothetical protein